MRMTFVMLALLMVSGCGDDDANHGGGPDLAVPDMSMPDLLQQTSCNQTDTMGDGQPCSGGCPANTIAVNLGGSCQCYATCTGNAECACDRLCDPVSLPDAGVVAKACLPGNLPGERCGRDTGGQAFGHVFCGQLTTCVNADAAQMFRYCSYLCNTQADCPAQTQCQSLTDTMGNPIGNVCAFTSGPNGNKSAGQVCAAGDVCKSGLLCDGTCVPQCDGPGATCASGTCTKLDDPASGKVIGYVCK
jgi:hypothetical protein